jgi:hypothetical protein
VAPVLKIIIQQKVCCRYVIASGGAYRELVFIRLSACFIAETAQFI